MRRKSGNTNRGPRHNRHKHGMVGTPTYKSWSEMKRRCYVATSRSYLQYGGRGILVAERWHTFENFLSDMGIRPDGTTLDRIDGSKGYEPGNCRWADRKTQSRNRNYVRLNPEAVEHMRTERASGKTLERLAEEYGVSVSHAHRVVTGASWT